MDKIISFISQISELSQCYNLALLKDTRHERPIPALGTLLSTTEQIRPLTYRCGDANETSSSHIYGNQSKYKSKINLNN